MSNHRFDVPSRDGSEILTLELRAGEDTAHLVARRPKLSDARMAALIHDLNTHLPQVERDLKPDLGRPTGKVQTYSGVLYNVVEPRVQDIRLEDIAHHLSNQCRYSGATRRHYSVGEHSIWVSLLVPAELAKVALLHDAEEAYVLDMPRPVKHLPELAFYRDLGARNERAVAERFGFDFALFSHPDVQRADVEALAMECRQLMPWEHAREWWGDLATREPSAAAINAQYTFGYVYERRYTIGLLDLMIRQPSPEQVEEAFLRRAAELGIS